MNQGKTWQEDIKEPRGYTFGPSFLQISYTREKLFNKLNVKLKLNIFKFFLEVKTTEDKYSCKERGMETYMPKEFGMLTFGI